ncbi:MAG: HAD family hydrolase [Anaerolineales bacterium]|nr:HAD family hydrolase [Anaerolineales bacterium]
MTDKRNRDKNIGLIVLDIDGVVTEGESAPLDLDFLGTLAGMNQRARSDNNLPPVTLCTGRPAPYLELMLQAIDSHLPGIFENGAGLYFPENYRFVAHPLVANDGTIRAVRELLEQGPIGDGKAYIQPGKIHTLTIFATDPEQTDQLKTWTESALGDRAKDVDLVYSTSCLNILPPAIDKAKGIEFLSQETGYAPETMLGVGDSDVDIPFLQLVGHSAAPSNAVPAIKEIVDYVSTERTSRGVLDILEEYKLLP